MAKLQSLKAKAKDRLEENDEQIQALKTTNDQLKEMLDSSEKEQERLKSEMKTVELSKQVIELSHEKINDLVSDLVRHKPGCTATEDG